MLLVDFLTAVNTLLPFDTLSRQGTPQLFHSTALLPALNKLQQVFSVPGNLTQRATLKQLRKRVRHHTSQLEWNAPLGGYILRAGSFTPAFRFEGPTLTWKQFWRAVGCVLDGQDGVLERVEAYPDGQGFRLIMTSEVQQAPVRVEGSRMEMLGRTMSLFATEPWRLSPVQFKDFSTLVSLPDVGLDATNAHDRRLMIAHGEWYLKRTSETWARTKTCPCSDSPWDFRRASH